MSENVDSFVVECRLAEAYEVELASVGSSVRRIMDAAMKVAFRGPFTEIEDLCENTVGGLNEDPGYDFSQRVEFYAEQFFDDEELSSVRDAASVMARLCSEDYGLELVERLVEFFCRGVAGEIENVSAESVSQLLYVLDDCACVVVYTVG